MAPRTISEKAALDTVWENLVYQEARLSMDPLAQDQTPLVTMQLTEWETVARHQRDCWRRVVVTRAGVDTAAVVLNVVIGELARTLLFQEDNERKSPRFLRYFSTRPSEIIRLGLESKLRIVRTWPESLAKDASPAIQELGTRLAAGIATGEAAITARDQAAATRADQRVNEILPFIAAVNGTRRSIYGLLVTRASAQKLERAWAEGFFLKETGKRPAKEPTPPA